MRDKTWFTVDVPSFYFTGDDYRYRFDPDAKRRFIDLLRQKFNEGVKYNGQIMKWDTIIEHKINELASFLTNKFTQIQFVEPRPIIMRNDSSNLRKRILEEANKLGFAKSTFYDMRNKAENVTSFTIYDKARCRLGVTN